MSICKRCGQQLGDSLSYWCMPCYRAHKAAQQAEIAQDDEVRLAAVTDTHQRCRGCGVDLYPVTDWVAEARRHNRKWFCGAECFKAWRFMTF